MRSLEHGYKVLRISNKTTVQEVDAAFERLRRSSAIFANAGDEGQRQMATQKLKELADAYRAVRPFAAPVNSDEWADRMMIMGRLPDGTFGNLLDATVARSHEQKGDAVENVYVGQRDLYGQSQTPARLEGIAGEPDRPYFSESKHHRAVWGGMGALTLLVLANMMSQQVNNQRMLAAIQAAAAAPHLQEGVAPVANEPEAEAGRPAPFSRVVIGYELSPALQQHLQHQVRDRLAMCLRNYEVGRPGLVVSLAPSPNGCFTLRSVDPEEGLPPGALDCMGSAANSICEGVGPVDGVTLNLLLGP